VANQTESRRDDTSGGRSRHSRPQVPGHAGALGRTGPAL